MKNVLILEDDIVDQMALTRMMAKNFPLCQVEICHNLAETLHSLKNKSYKWIISDFNLPDGTLVEILPFIGSANLICVSGELETEEINSLKKNGLYNFFIKDQQLEYLDKIKNEMSNYDEKIKIKSPEPIGKSTNKVYQSLTRHFDNDNSIKKEIIEIFLNDIYPIQIQNLLKAVNSKDKKSTHFLSHKTQSSFRVLGAKDILATLNKWEIESSKDEIDWSAILNESTSFFEKVNLFQNIVKDCRSILSNQ